MKPHGPRPDSGSPVEASHFAGCALISHSSQWSEELASLGVRLFKKPEGLYKTLRSRELLPEACIVDLDHVPRNLVKAIDIRVPCPKLWVGRAAANPADIKNFGIYYARARPEELNTVVDRLVRTERSIVLPSAIAGGQLLPVMAAEEEYCEDLHHYSDHFAETNLITLHGDDPLELQLASQYLAVDTRRPRIWEVRSEASVQSTLRKIAQARRPGTDVTIVVSTEVDAGTAREFYRSMPAEYSMIKLAARTADPVDDALSFTLPRLVDRPADIESWITWLVCRSTVEYGVALSGLPGLIPSIGQALENPTIDEIKTVCERSVRQHATMMEDHGRFMCYEDLVHNFERTILRQALTQHDWNLSATAKSLGLAESSLRYKLSRLGIVRSGGPSLA